MMMSKVSALIVALKRIGKIKIISKQVFHTLPLFVLLDIQEVQIKTPLVELEIDMSAHLNNILKAPQSHSVYTIGEAGIQIKKTLPGLGTPELQYYKKNMSIFNCMLPSEQQVSDQIDLKPTKY